MKITFEEKIRNYHKEKEQCQTKNFLQFMNKFNISNPNFFTKYFSQQLKENPLLFKEQGQFVDNHVQISNNLFIKHFGKENFEENARKYLRERGILQDRNTLALELGKKVSKALSDRLRKKVK